MDRAYPRSYVETKRALAGRAAVTRARARSARARARANVRTAARVLDRAGPVTPTVPARVTYTGRATTNSGRVTAMAIDPNCGSGPGCRVWVGAAGGGIWRTDNALAATPTWTPASDGMASNAIGSLTVDSNELPATRSTRAPASPTARATPRPASASTSRPTAATTGRWCPGSRAVALDRSIGAVLGRPGHPSHIFIGTDVARHGASSRQRRRCTPPNAPELGIYESTDGGARSRWPSAGRRTRATVIPTGVDWFQGGVNKLGVRPVGSHDASTPRSSATASGAARRTSTATARGTRCSATRNPPDTFGDRTEFALPHSQERQARASTWATAPTTRASPSCGAPTPRVSSRRSSPTATRTRRAGRSSPTGQRHAGLHVVQLLPERAVRLRRLRRGRPPTNPDIVWLGGSMALRRAPDAGHDRPVQRPRGRALDRRRRDVHRHDQRRANAGRAACTPTSTRSCSIPANPKIAFVGSDGGVVRPTARTSTAAGLRLARPRQAADLADCQRWLSAIPQQIDDAQRRAADAAVPEPDAEPAELRRTT